MKSSFKSGSVSPTTVVTNDNNKDKRISQKSTQFGSHSTTGSLLGISTSYQHASSHGNVGSHGGTVYGTYFNPFVNTNLSRRSSSRRRWMHLFRNIQHGGVNVNGTTYTNNYPFPINWKSISEPASLPLTTDYFPDSADLNKMYTEYVYSLSPAVDDPSSPSNLIELLKELVSQRLAQV